MALPFPFASGLLRRLASRDGRSSVAGELLRARVVQGHVEVSAEAPGARSPKAAMTSPADPNALPWLAWAGGFFDGEGSTYLEKHRTHVGYFVPRLYVPQSADIGIAVELTRLKSALGGLGTISGMRPFVC